MCAKERLRYPLTDLYHRFRLLRELGNGVREIGGAELEDRLRWERVSLGKAHSEAVREIDGEQAYEKMRWAVEKASQAEKAIQVERASQPVRTSQFPARKRPERRGPERGGPERDYGPSR